MRYTALFSILTLALGAQQAPEAPKPEPAKVVSEPAKPIPVKVAPAPQPAASVAAAPKAAPAKEETVPEDQILGHLGKRVIREKDFLVWLKAMAGAKRFEQMVKTPSGLVRPRQQFLDTQVLASKARKEKTQNLPELKTELGFQEDQLLVKYLMNEERSGSEGQRIKEKVENPSEEEMKAYFEKNRQRFDSPEKFTARHILVGLKGAPRSGDKGLTEEEAKARIAKIQEEMKAGKKFEDLVKEYSDDPGSKNTGGLYKDISYGSFAKEFEEAVRKQELGQVGEPVKTTFGYHIIKVESRTAQQSAEFEQVKDKVKQQMLPERREAMFKAFMEETKKEIGFTTGAEAANETPKPAKKEAKPSVNKTKG